MWQQISDIKSMEQFMHEMCSFHDSCIKEMRYTSGAYVKENGWMHPVNTTRALRVAIHRQAENHPVIELEFEKLRFLKLFPNNENCTSEILDSTMLMQDGCIYWMDSGCLTASDIENYKGTIICAENLRWRSIDGCLGEEDYFLDKSENR